MKRAAIAIGSNSTRLLVAEKKSGTFIPCYRGREETRLFLGLDEAGNISADRLEETAQAVKRLDREAVAQGAKSVTLFATSAARDAGNGANLAARIYALCGLPLRIISGEEEARLAFLAAAGKARRLVMDIGGGSTEFTLGENGIAEFATSAQMGASRLLKMCPIASPQDAERAYHLAREALLPLTERLAPRVPAPMLIGLGGTCTTAAAISLGHIATSEEAEGRIISREEAAGQLRLLASLPLEERKQVPGLPPSRAVHMPHGLCILLAALDLCGMNQVTVSIRTNLDGYLLSLPEEE